MQANRRTERIAIELPVIWHRRGGNVSCVALDLNAHGMFLATRVVVEHGALMRICVRLPEGDDLELFVTARYVGRTLSGQGIGVEIFLAEEAARDRWSRFYRAELARRIGDEPLRLAG